MATDQSANTLIRDLVMDVQAQEPKARQKANTVTSVIGTVLTTVATITAYILQSGLELSPAVVVIVAIIGMVATDFAVSKTPNGITNSTADRFEMELARRIDLNHNHDETVVAVNRTESDPHSLRVEADRMATDFH